MWLYLWILTVFFPHFGWVYFSFPRGCSSLLSGSLILHLASSYVACPLLPLLILTLHVGCPGLCPLLLLLPNYTLSPGYLLLSCHFKLHPRPDQLPQHQKSPPHDRHYCMPTTCSPQNSGFFPLYLHLLLLSTLNICRWHHFFSCLTKPQSHP